MKNNWEIKNKKILVHSDEIASEPPFLKVEIPRGCFLGSLRKSLVVDFALIGLSYRTVRQLELKTTVALAVSPDPVKVTVAGLTLSCRYPSRSRQ